MANEREQITESILAVLGASAMPLKAREIADALHRQGLAVTKTDVNSVLYGDLSHGGMVAQDGEYQWFIADQSREGAANGQKLAVHESKKLQTPGREDES